MSLPPNEPEYAGRADPPDTIYLCSRCKYGLLRNLQDSFYCFKCGGSGDSGIVYVREQSDRVLEVRAKCYNPENEAWYQKYGGV